MSIGRCSGRGLGVACYEVVEAVCLTAALPHLLSPPPLSWICLGFLPQEFYSRCPYKGSVTWFMHLSVLTRGFYHLCFNGILSHWDLSPTACDSRQNPMGGNMYLT